jgi:hypothetical protein
MLRTWPRTALLVLGAMCQHSVDAQLGDPLHRLLNGDSLAPPNYDTAYIATYRSRLVVSTVCKYRFADIDLERADDEGTLSFSTNSNEQYGFGIDYKWLSAEVTFNVPVLNQYDPSLGRTDSRNFGLGYTGRRLWIRGFWDRTEGYFMNEADRWLGERPGAAPYTRPDLNSDTYMLSVNYALSLKKRFSQNAAIAQMERQKRSAGTWLAGLSAWRNTVAGDSSLLSPNLLDTFHFATGFNAVERTIVGATIGYTHTWSFRGKGFVHVAMLYGPGYMQQRITPNEGAVLAGTSTALVGEMKLGAGFNGDRWYAAITTAYFLSSGTISENDVSLAMNHGFARMAIGLRLGAPGIRILRKVGL